MKLAGGSQPPPSGPLKNPYAAHDFTRAAPAAGAVQRPAHAPVASSFGIAARPAGAPAEPGRVPSLEELAAALHGHVEAAPALLRGASRTPSPAASGHALDATPEHPVYGAYLREWLADAGNAAEPGKSLLGLLRSTLGDLRSAISRGAGDKFRAASPDA